MYKLCCVGFITYMTGMAAAKVGEIPKNPTEPFSWWIVLMMLWIMVFPAILAYMAGKEDASKNTP